MRKTGVFLLGMIAVAGWLSAAAGLFAEEPKGPEFKEAIYFGGAGDQGAAQDGMGIAVSGTKLYLSGADLSLYGGQALVGCYTIPTGTSPDWAFRWPNQKMSGWWNDESFPGVAVTHEGLYCAGRSFLTTDSVGGKEGKSVLAKFPLNGPTGPAAGGALWIAKPLFFPYNGIETFMAVTAAVEGGQTFLYATGRGQWNGSDNTAVAAKFDTAGNVLWKKVLVREEWNAWSQGDSVIAHDGSIYIAGYTHWQGLKSWLGLKNPIRPHAGLWKLDPNGNVLWARESAEPIYQNSGAMIRCVASGQFLYVVCAREVGADGVFTYDLLLLKYDEAGNLLWSKQWGGAKDEVPMGLAVADNRLYAVGYTTGWVGGGGKDAFLLEVDAEKGEVLSVAYHGGPNDDVPYGVQVAGKELYVVGDSKSSPGDLGHSEVMLLRYGLVREPPVLMVPIDIKPGGVPNSINMKSKGNVPVAILSRADFDAPKLVDRASLTFGRTGDEKSLLAGMVKPEDVNGDGLPDLVAHFDTPKTGFLLGDTQGFLKGKLLSGRLFMGVDSVRIVGKEEKKEPPKRQPDLKKEIKPVPPKRELPRGGVPTPGGIRKTGEDKGLAY